MPQPDAEQASAFADVRVLDLTIYPGGGLAAMHLGEFGAQVLRPAHDDASAFARDLPLSLYAHRNKHVVPVGEDELPALVAGADVVIVDRPLGELAAAGLTRELLRTHNGVLIHAWLPPHAPRGVTSELPADELLLSAWTGMADQQPGASCDQPVAPVVPILTYEHGALGAAAIAAALVGRAATGRPTSLTVSGLHAVAAMNTTLMVDLPGIFRPFGAQKDGAGSSPFFRMYQCRDGHWIFVCALTPAFFFRLLDSLGLMDLMTMPGVEGDFQRLLDPEVQKLATAEIARRIARQDIAGWEHVFGAAGVPYAPVQPRETWSASETVAANRLLLRTLHPDHGEMVMPGLPVELAATPGSLHASASTRPPDRDTSGARGVLGDGHLPHIPAHPSSPLDGMVVVDATKFVAGPFASLLLQDFGATVIKVDPVGGEDFRAVAGASSSALNRDKAQVGLDLAEAADKERFYSLVDRADVLIENMSRKVVDKLGIDPDRLRSGKGNLVHCHIEGWGAGPLEDTPAFDPLLQARSGLMVAQGGPETPVIQAASVHDIGTGTFAAFGILAALYARTHLQTGPDVRMSLSRASIAFQGAEFTTFAGRHEPPTGHLDYLGEGPAHRLYRCSDGWVAIGAASPATRDALDRVAGGRLGERTSTAETTFATRTVASVLAACRAAEVPAVRVLPRDEIFTSDDLAENEFFLTIADDDLGEIQAVRGFSEWDGVPPRGHAMTRAAGSDTDAVLQGNGALTPRPI